MSLYRMMDEMRQPVHVVYGGAQLFKSDTCRKLGKLAERALGEYAPDAAALAEVLEIPADIAATVHERVTDKLRREPIEAYHIDFEDGFGIRPDAEEDAAADAAGAQFVKAAAEGIGRCRVRSILASASCSSH